MKITKKFKFACASLLAVCCIGTAAAGVMLSGGSTSAKADEPKALWEGETGKVFGDVTVFDKSVSIRNNVNILSLPNQTGVFYMYYTDASSGWNGISFRNGNDGIGYAWNLSGGASLEAFPWHSICFEAANQHMILNDSRRINTAGGGTFGGINGVDGENFLNGMIPVEVHIGNGAAANDKSYIKIGGVELLHEQVAVSVTQASTRGDTGSSQELTASMFPKGCYVTVNYNVGSELTHELALSDVGSVVTTDASMDALVPYQAGEFADPLTATLNCPQEALAEGYSVVGKINGYDLPEGSLTVSKKGDTQLEVSVAAEKLNAIPKESLRPMSYFTFEVKNGETSYGSAAVGAKILFEAPPEFEETDLALDKKGPFSYHFTYSGSETPEDSLEMTYSVTGPQISLKRGTDFTVTKTGTKYTVTVTETGAEKIFNGHAAASITMTFGPHTVHASVYVDGQITEYGIRFREGIDYVDGTLNIDEYYASAKVQKLDTAKLSSRIFYENGVDVSKPIIIEYEKLDPSIEWMLISLMSNPTLSETFSNEFGPAAGNIVSFIMFGDNRNNMQGMQHTFTNDNTTDHAPNTTMKNNYVEIVLGAENAADGYVKFNGERIPLELSRSQKDFPSGKAYVGFFFNNKNGDVNFSCNTHVNPVVVNGPQDDSAYRMDLGAAKDFSVDLTNTSGKLTLKDESGTEIPAAQYSYADGKLTIKAEYFSTKAFVQEGRIYIWDTEKKVGTAFRLAYSNSAMGNAHIAYATKGANQDVTFDLGVTAVSGILQKGEPVSAEHYTVEGGKLIIKAAALKDEVGAQEFFVTADGKMFPCYVYVDNFENGVALGNGAVRTEKGYTLTDVTSLTEAVTYDLSKGFKLGFSFTSIARYYERRANSDGTRFTLKFLDPMSGNSFVISVFANFEDDKITSANNALYLSYSIVDGEGKTVWSENPRGMTPTDGNNSASGEHNFEISEKNGGLTLTVAGRPCSISANNLSDFGFKSCVLTLTTEGVAAGSETELVLGGYGASTPDTPDNPDTPDKPDNPENPDAPDGGDEADNGCGSVIGGYGWMIALAAIVLSAGLILFLRRRENK